MFRLVPRLAVALLAVLSPAVALAADPARVPAAWHDLLTTDDATATRAVLALSSTPKETIEFLRANLLSFKADKEQLVLLVKQLGDRDYHVREAAQKELIAYGATIRVQMEDAQQTAASLEARDRIRRVLSRIRIGEMDEKALTEGNPLAQGQPYINYVGNQPKVFINGKQLDLTPRVITLAGPPPMYLRAARAIAVLEHIGTPDAIQLLESVAQGDTVAPPTRQAQEALGRMKGKK